MYRATAIFGGAIVAMDRNLIADKEGEEYKRLYLEFVVAMAHAGAVLQKHGMDSPEFREADTEAGAIWSRLREIRGETGEHWMV